MKEKPEITAFALTQSGRNFGFQTESGISVLVSAERDRLEFAEALTHRLAEAAVRFYERSQPLLGPTASGFCSAHQFPSWPAQKDCHICYPNGFQSVDLEAITNAPEVELKLADDVQRPDPKLNTYIFIKDNLPTEYFMASSDAEATNKIEQWYEDKKGQQCSRAFVPGPSATLVRIDERAFGRNRKFMVEVARWR